MKKDDVAKKYMEFQILSQQIQQSQQQIQVMSQQVSELKRLSKNISEIAKSKEDSEMYTNLGVGVHIKSQIKDIKNLLVNVGAGVFVKKTPEETVKIIDQQAIELDKYLVNLDANTNQSVEKAEKLRQEISEAQKEKA